MTSQLRATKPSTIVFALGLLLMTFALLAGGTVGQQADAAPTPVEYTSITTTSGGIGDLP